MANNTRNFRQYINSFYNVKLDPQKKMYPEAAVKEWINDAITDICNWTGILEMEVKQNSIASRSEYVMPFEVLRPARLTYDGDNNPLYEKTFEDLDAIYENNDERTTPSTPEYFTLYRNTIFLTPPPEFANKVIHLYSKRLHEKLVNLDDAVNIKIDRYNKAILQFCFWRAEERVGNTEAAIAKYNLYEKFREEVNKGRTPRKVGPSRVRDITEMPSDFYVE